MKRLRDSGFTVLTCFSGRHRAGVQQVLDFFSIPLDIDAHVGNNEQPATAMTRTVLEQMESVLARTRPQWVLVVGSLL